MAIRGWRAARKNSSKDNNLLFSPSKRLHQCRQPGPPPGLGLDLSTVDAYAAAGVDRLFTFAPGFVPRGKLSSDLFPAMERFAADVMRG